MLVPDGLLGIFKDTCTGDGGLRDHDGDVRVTGDDLTLADDFAGVPDSVIVLKGLVRRGGSFASVTGCETTSEVFGHHVHVR